MISGYSKNQEYTQEKIQLLKQIQDIQELKIYTQIHLFLKSTIKINRLQKKTKEIIASYPNKEFM